jgi:hypothetical protein
MVSDQKPSGNNRHPRFLFKNFLADKRVYRLNQAFWRKQVQSAVGIERPLSYNWVNDAFSNGRPFWDGNPIFSARLSAGKALRIVQEEPESPTVEFGCWTEKTTFENDQEVEELVISLELSRESQQLALEAIRQWVEEGYAKDAT